MADQITKETGQIAKRKIVIERCVNAGGNPNTASTQYSYWKSAQRQMPTPRNVSSDRLTISTDGRVVIPIEMRRAMRLGDQGAVTATVVNGELRLISPTIALEKAQALVENLVSSDVSMADELIAERRKEALREGDL
ncbi:MAG: hypothetical protein ACU0DI_13190 [Paracoccaceae bacterium]